MTIPPSIKPYFVPATCVVVGVLLGLALTYLPKPTMTDAPTSTKESTVSFAGKTKPKMGLILLNAEGHMLLTLNADEKGDFRFANVPLSEGTTTFILRAVTRGWRASFPLRLTVFRDTTAPQLSITSPNGGSVTGSNYLMSGKAEPGSTVTVNGVTATVASDGTWSATVALQSGKNTLTVMSADAAGNTTTLTESIVYTPSAPGSQTGTASTTQETVTYSEGSLPPATSTPATPSGATTTSPTQTSSPTQTASPTTGTSQPIVTTPPPQPTSIVVTPSVSNLSPNSRSTQQIYAKVTTNLGTPATDAVVTAVAHYKNGDVTYALAHSTNGNYVASFKLGERFVADYTVVVDVTAKWGGFTSTGRTTFTPR